MPRGASGASARVRASQSAAAETRKDAVSIAHTVDGPAVLYTPAAIAGPITALLWRAMPSHEFADASVGVSTTSGMVPPNAGWKKPIPRPKHAARASTAPKLGWPV